MLSAVANHLWQSTILAGVAGLLTLALRRNSARVRFWLWMAASVKFLIPFAAFVAIGGLIHQRTAPVKMRPAMTVAVEEINQTLTPVATQAPSLPAASSTNRLPEILFAIWAIGFIGISASWALRWRRVRAAVQSGSTLQLGLPVRVVSSPALLEPGVFGIFRPILLLPDGILERLTPEQLEAIVAHELCHVRRRDNLFAAIHMLVEAIFWFHPLVWWLRTRLTEERERACDEEVLGLGNEPRAYAQSILSICELYLESPLECVAGVGGANLKRRIEGIMNHRGALRLNLAKRFGLAVAGVCAAAIPLAVGLLHAQPAPGNTPKWEAVSIRPCEPAPDVPGRRSGGMSVSPARLHVACLSLGFLVSAAYSFADDRDKLTFEVPPNGVMPFTGGPAWMRSSQWDIEAKAEGNPSAQKMQGPMLQAILEDRFKLKVHLEAREGPVYDLTVAKGGLKFQPMKEGSCVPFDALNLGTKMRADSQAALAELAKSCGRSGMTRQGILATAEFHGMDFDQVSKWLTRALDRPVVNKTGISGMFDFQFEFAPDEATPNFRPVPTDDPAGGPSIFTAIQEAAGLKLEGAKGMVQHIVVDGAEKPSDN